MIRPLFSVLARFGALLLLVAVPAAAQEADASPSVPAAVEARVRALVAERWQVAEERLTLEFGALPALGITDRTGVELLGSGGGGHWIVRLTEADSGDGASMRIRAGVRTDVPVAARALSRGHVLSDLDVDLAAEVLWGPPAAAEPGPTEGWVVQRMVRAGEPLRTPAVQPPLAVRSGHPVEVVWNRGAVGIRMRGKALGSALIGAEVFVRTEGGERLRGIVSAPGVVDVTRGGTDR